MVKIVIISAGVALVAWWILDHFLHLSPVVDGAIGAVVGGAAGVAA